MDDDASTFLFIGPLIGGLILYAITRVLVRLPGVYIRRKFNKVGTLRGKSFHTIVAIVGSPTSRSVTGNGKTLYQWMATGYHIALLFDGDICEGVTHEFASFAVRKSVVAQSPAVVSTPIPPSRTPEKTAEVESIPCPLCEKHIRISTLKQGDNWCPHCFEKFIAE